MLTSITGINWGDEGKGRMVDLLSQNYDIVARYQGGDNAGHTVKNERGKFVLNLIPSGILRPDVVCVMGGGMVIDPEHLEKEIASLTEKGVEITPKNLKISDRATITMPFHVAQDGLEEERLSKTGAQFGSTKRGIAYSYGDKYMKKTRSLSASRRCGPGARSTGSCLPPTSAMWAAILTRLTARARRSCSRPSSAHCATSTSAFIPIPLLPTPFPPMRPSVRASRAIS